MPAPRLDLLAEIRQHASTALLSDVLDREGPGYRQQVLHHRLRPLLPGLVVAGWARTIRWLDVDHVDQRPYDVEIELIDSLRPGDFVVHSQDPGLRNCPWGELMSTAAVFREAVGCLCDSNIRDVRRIRELEFPVWHTAVRPLDSCGRGKVVAYDVPVVCGEVLVRPGDLIVADDDGAICVPQGLVEIVVPKAVAKGRTENKTRDGLRAGRTLKQMYDEYGVM